MDNKDIRICNADCDKTHCARNKRNRYAKKNGGEDLKSINNLSLCDNYLPVFKVSIEQRREMFILRPFAQDRRRKELLKLIENKLK